MGKNRKSSQKGKKSNQKSTDRKTTEPLATYINEVQRSVKENNKHEGNSVEIWDKENLPSTVAERNCNSGDGKRSTKDIKVGKQSSRIKESDMIDEEINGMLYRISKSNQVIMENIFSNQYAEEPSSISMKLKDFDNFLKSELPEIFKHMVKCIKLMEKQLCLQNFPNIQKKLNIMSKSGAFGILIAMISKKCNIDEESLKILEEKVENDRMTTDKGKEEMNYSDNVENASHSLQQLAKDNKDEIVNKWIASNVPEIESGHHDAKLDVDEETLMKIIDSMDENSGKPKDSSSMELMNETSNLCHRQKKGENNSFQDFHNVLKNTSTFQSNIIVPDFELLRDSQSTLDTIRQMQNLYFFEKDCLEKCSVEFEIRSSKEKADKINCVELEETDHSMDYIKVSNQSKSIMNQNPSEDKRREKTCRKSIEKPFDFQNFHSNKTLINTTQETENNERKDIKNKAAFPKIPKSSHHGDFISDLKKFFKLQKLRLNEETQKETVMLEKISTGKVSDSSFKAEHLAVIAKTESHEATRNETKLNENATLKDELDEPSPVIVELDKNDGIHFELETSNTKHIYAGNNYYYFPFKYNQDLILDYKDENVQVSFRGNKVCISTKYNEFYISIHNSTSVSSMDEATQT